MVAWVLPLELLDRADVQPGEERIYLQHPPVPDGAEKPRSSYLPSRSRAFEVLPVKVVGVSPLTVRFFHPQKTSGDWRDPQTGDPFPPDTVVPTSRDVIVPLWRVGALYEQFEQWRDAKADRLRESLESQDLVSRAERVRDDIGLWGSPSVLVSAAGLLALADELDSLRAAQARADELEGALEQLEAAEERDVLGFYDATRGVAS